MQPGEAAAGRLGADAQPAEAVDCGAEDLVLQHVGGELVELDLDQTPVKYHVFDGQGLTAYQVTGVVLDLDPGTYVTKFTQSSPYWSGEDYEAAVTLVVTG